jgi:haloalkane dehalogenase
LAGLRCLGPRPRHRRLVAAATTTSLTDAQVAAYDAPFENPDAKAGAAIFPALVPTHPDDPEAAADRRAWERLERFNRPFLCLYSDQDPITAGGDQRFRARIPGAAGQPNATIADAGHFLQEDQPHQLADRLDRWMRQTTPEP